MDATPESDRRPTNGRFEVAVVGAGLAGLAAAATAARAGAATVVLDGRSIGGRARSTDRAGYTLNEGAHALYRAGRGQAVLDRLGVSLTGAAPSLADYRVVVDGSVEQLPVSPKALMTTSVLSSQSKLQLSGWWAQLERLARKAPGVTLDEWMEAHRARPDLRRFVTVMARLTTYGADPGAFPAASVLRQLAVSSGGVRYIDGGWQSIVDGLRGACERAGVTIAEHATVGAAEQQGATWTVSGAQVDLVAEAIVLAVPPAVAAGLLGTDRADWAGRAGSPLRAACLDIGAAPGAVSFLLSADEPLYLSQHAPVARLAPEGRALYSLMRYLDGVGSGHAIDRETLERHAAVAGVPAERDVERFLAASVVAWGRPQVGVDRPTGLELAADGVYAAGDWVGPAMLADAALDSGAAAGAAAATRAKVTA